MRYNLTSPTETDQAFTYLTELVGKGTIVEIKKISPARTLNQNAYLHLIIGDFGNHFGYTAGEAKLIYKYVNTDLYKYRKNSIVFYRSSADLTKEEMAQSIDKFREYSEHTAGYVLPLATDQAWLMEIQNEIERSKYNSH